MENSQSAALRGIQSALKKMADPAARASFQKFIPTCQNVYGVRVPFLNELAKQYKSAKFDLVWELWNSGAFEEKLLAVKILGRICKSDPDETLALLAQFSKEIMDWAVCDTLATQGIRGICKIKQEEIFDLAKKFLKSNDFWQRRLGIVLLTNYAKDPSLRSQIEGLIEPLADDKETYINKAIVWIRKDLNK